jgi:hypothetical protein
MGTLNKWRGEFIRPGTERTIAPAIKMPLQKYFFQHLQPLTKIPKDQNTKRPAKFLPLAEIAEIAALFSTWVSDCSGD